MLQTVIVILVALWLAPVVALPIYCVWDWWRLRRIRYRPPRRIYITDLYLN